MIGREWEVANLSDLLRRGDARLITLTGPGGVGKTRLALAVAETARGHFEEGVYFIPLASIHEPGLVLPAIAQALGVKAIGGHTLEDTLQQYLADRHVLLVLDNFEHVLEAALVVSALLAAAAQLAFVLTSRSVLRLGGEREFSVPTLTVPDPAHLPPVPALLRYEAVRLFVERAQAARRDFALTAANAQAVADIVNRLDGLPLAVELAAARIKLMSPAALLDHLSSPLALLTGGPRDAPARQQTLRATIEWSYELLPAEDQALLMCLGVFNGGCTLPAASWVCASGNDADDGPQRPSSPSGEALEGVSRLLDQSLLQIAEGAAGEARITLLEIIREYALEHLTGSGRLDTIRRRHAAHYLAYVEANNAKLISSEQRSWLAQLEAEHDNLRDALAWFAGALPEAGLRLACMLCRFWEIHSHLTEGRTWLARLLPLCPDAPARLRAEALTGAGMLAYLQADYQAAVASLTESLALAGELDEPTAIASNLRSLGLVAWFQGDSQAGRAQLQASVDLYRRVPHTWELADALHWLGHVVLDQGGQDLAHRLFEESLALFRQTGDQRNIALPLKDFGLMASQRGDHAAASAFFEESLALSRAVDDTWHVADTLQRAGDLARIQADDEHAMRNFQESLALWQRLGNQGGIAEALNLLGESAWLRGDYAEAEAKFTQSLGILRGLGSQRVIAGVLHSLGLVVEHTQGQHEARARFLEALSLNESSGYVPGIADCLVGLAGLAAADGSAAYAAQLLGAAERYLGTPRGYMPLRDRGAYDRVLAAVAQPLEAAVLSSRLAGGRALSLDEAVAIARGGPPAETPQPPLPAAYPAGLTEREVEVLRLVAQGLTDAQVAERLVISPRTVNGHLRSIYGKLKVSSRAAATNYAVTHRLV